MAPSPEVNSLDPGCIWQVGCPLETVLSLWHDSMTCSGLGTLGRRSDPTSIVECFEQLDTIGSKTRIHREALHCITSLSLRTYPPQRDKTSWTHDSPFGFRLWPTALFMFSTKSRCQRLTVQVWRRKWHGANKWL